MPRHRLTIAARPLEQAAAQSLYLSRSSCFRRLRQAVERLAAHLAARAR
jgi:hypothetical protein